ncbi:MAG TPA: hypothetical protein VKY82_04495 [Flavobacterium sp.]|nr:hypothetical protein [Flavobacterium sp.]
MKKIALLAAVFTGFATLQSCTIEEYYDDYESMSQVFEKIVDIDVPEDRYTNSATWDFQPPIYDSDNVIMYRWEGNAWRMLPITYALNNDGDQIYYDYDFTRYDVKVYVSTNFDFELLSNAEYNAFVRNQTLRIVVVPGGFAKADYSDYNATIKMLGLENTPVKKLDR